MLCLCMCVSQSVAQLIGHYFGQVILYFVIKECNIHHNNNKRPSLYQRYGLCIAIETIVGDIFIFFQNFKLFFHKKNVFNLFVENCRETFEPYVVVSACNNLRMKANSS